jgi:hypothetical protein
MIALGSTRIALCAPGTRLAATVADPAARAMRTLCDTCRPSGVAGGFVADLTRSRAELITENALLRQQLIVASRGVKRPAFRVHERAARAAREPASSVVGCVAAGQARDAAAMASGGIPTLLASEVSLGAVTRTAHRARRRRSHPPRGDREPALGRRADSRRAVEARGPPRETHGSTVHARLAVCGSPRRTELADVSAKPHGLGLRLPAGLRRLVPSDLRVFRRRRERQARRARGGDSRSDASVDRPAAAQRDAVRAGATVCHSRPRRQIQCVVRPRRQERRCSRSAHRGPDRH